MVLGVKHQPLLRQNDQQIFSILQHGWLCWREGLPKQSLSKQVLLPVRWCFTKRMCHTVEMHCVFSEPA